ncbi:hypothetical protein IEN85_13845 [Pelagicoccus sp. NFK12]|uniref:Uncharacterized protein n=1 Tax=Pelagicoccus enzymogenes TaxID=2773457 RepID=A0A927F928_9BACT|nr:hypothetical protein [Pelagicoccus enzymogenes]MBD5780579.1 hypothetical protein [Pelagicoccus enzymogenes]
MDKQEAKLILSSYTLENEPSNDPQFDAAKAVAANDPELASWWKSQKQADQSLSASLRSFEVPADLRSALKVTIAEKERKRLRFAQARKWFSIAAAFVLCSYLFFEYGIDRSDDYTGPLAQRAFDYSVDGPRLSYFDRDTSKLQTWLTQNGFDLPDQLPPKLLALEGVGCRPLDWSQEKVALMCFNADTVYHLFIGMENDFPEFEASEQIGYAQQDNGWTVSKWRDQDYLFVLTAKATVDEMSQFLASYAPGNDPLSAIR